MRWWWHLHFDDHRPTYFAELSQDGRRFSQGHMDCFPTKKVEECVYTIGLACCTRTTKPELVVARRVFVLNMEVVVPSLAHVVELAICKKTAVAFDELVLVLIEFGQPQAVIQKEIGAWFSGAVVGADRLRPEVLIEFVDY